MLIFSVEYLYRSFELCVSLFISLIGESIFSLSLCLITDRLEDSLTHSITNQLTHQRVKSPSCIDLVYTVFPMPELSKQREELNIL